MRHTFLSSASRFSVYFKSVSRDGIRRAGPLYRGALQVIRQRVRRKRDLAVAVAAPLAVIGLVVGLVAGLSPSSPASPLVGANDDAQTLVPSQAGSHASDSATASPSARQTSRVYQAAPVQSPAAPVLAPGRQQAPAREQAPARQQAPARNRPAAPSQQPYQMYDSTIPSAIPSGLKVATYATGKFAVSPSQVSGPGVTWIDTNASDPRNASVLDVEPGNVGPSVAATWVKERLTDHPTYTARVYTMLSEWPAVKAAIATIPHWMQSHVRWWIADPTGVPHVVPGSTATQWYWGSKYDISTVDPGF